jgi:hypothetical protein
MELIILKNSHLALFDSIKFLINMYTYKNLPLDPYMSQINPVHSFTIFIRYIIRLCGLVVRILGYRSRGRGSIPGTSEK